MVYRKGGKDLENSSDEIIDEIKTMSVQFVRERTQNTLSKQIIGSQLEFARKYKFSDYVFDTITDIGEGGEEEPVLNTNVNTQFDHDEKCKSRVLCYSVARESMFTLC